MGAECLVGLRGSGARESVPFLFFNLPLPCVRVSVSEPFFASPPPNSGKPGNKKWEGGKGDCLGGSRGGGEKPFLAHSLLSPGQCVPPPLLPFPLAPQNLRLRYNIPGLPKRIHPFSKVTKTSKDLLLPMQKNSVAFFI